MAEQMCEELLRQSGATGRAAKIIDGYLITASKVGRIATGRVTEMDLTVLYSGLTSGSLKGIDLYRGDFYYSHNLLSYWGTRGEVQDSHPLVKEDSIAQVAPVVVTLGGLPPVGKAQYWGATTPVTYERAVVSTGFLTWPDVPVAALTNTPPDTEAALEVSVCSLGDLARYSIDPVTGEVVQEPAREPAGGPISVRILNSYIKELTGGYGLLRDRRYWADNPSSQAGPYTPPVPIQITKNRSDVVTWAATSTKQWPGDHTIFDTGIQGFLAIRTVVDTSGGPGVSPIVHTPEVYSFSMYDHPVPDMRRLPVEDYVDHPDFSPSEVRSDTNMMAAAASCKFDGGAAFLVDTRHYTSGVELVGLPVPGGGSGNPGRATYSNSLLLIRVFTDGGVSVSSLRSNTNNPPAGATLGVVAAHTLDGLAVFHVHYAICNDPSEYYRFEGWSSTQAPTDVALLDQSQLVTYHVSATGVEEFTPVDDVAAADFVYVPYGGGNEYYDRPLNYGRAYTYLWVLGNRSPAAAIDRYRAVVMMRTYHNLQGVPNPAAGRVMAYIYDVRTATYTYAGDVGPGTEVQNINHVYVVQEAKLDPETGEEVESATLITTTIDPGGQLPPPVGPIGKTMLSTDSGKTWTVVGDKTSISGAVVLGNALLRSNHGHWFD